MSDQELAAAVAALRSEANTSEKGNFFSRVAKKGAERWRRLFNRTSNTEIQLPPRNPATPERSVDQENRFGGVGASETRGRRSEMQDAHYPDIDHGDRSENLFIVCDGHGLKGERAASIGVQVLAGLEPLIDGGLPFDQAAQRVFDQADQAIKADRSLDNGGATAVLAYLEGDILRTAHAGDARITLLRDDGSYQRTEDHKPDDLREIERIERAGGTVQYNAGALRVNGVIAVARALGDATFGDIITHKPDINSFDIGNAGAWAITTCDGVWEVLDPDDLPRIIGNETDPQKVSKLIMQAAFDAGSGDNITVVATRINPKSVIQPNPTLPQFDSGDSPTFASRNPYGFDDDPLLRSDDGRDTPVPIDHTYNPVTEDPDDPYAAPAQRFAPRRLVTPVNTGSPLLVESTPSIEPATPRPGLFRRWGRNIGNLNNRAKRIGQAVATAGGAIREQGASILERAGQKIDTAWDVLKRGPDGIKNWLIDINEKLKDKRETPAGKAVEAALLVITKDTIDSFKKQNNGRPITKTDLIKTFAKTLGMGGAVYMREKMLESVKSTPDTAKAFGNYMKDHWKDVATGAVVGAGSRVAFAAAGAGWASFLGGAVLGAVREADRQISANEIDKPETLRARADLLNRYRSLPAEKRKELQLGRKMLLAGAVSAAGALIGSELMQLTGLGDLLHNALGEGINKAGELLDSLKGTAESYQIPSLFEPATAPVDMPGYQAPPLGIDGGAPAIAIDHPAPDLGFDSHPAPGALDTAHTLPHSAADVSIDAPQGIEHSSALLADGGRLHAPEAPINLEALPTNFNLPEGSDPWKVAEQILKAADPSRTYSAADIMKVDMAICQANHIAVPEWNINGEGWKLASSLTSTNPDGSPFKFNVDDNVKNVIKGILQK